MDVAGETFMATKAVPSAALPPSFVAVPEESQAELMVKVAH